MDDVGEPKLLKDKLNLRQLILILSVFSVLITLINAFYSMYKVQQQLIVTNTIESNRVYAEKMAETTDLFIESAFSQLEYSADLLSKGMSDIRVQQQEVDRLRRQTSFFNSVVIVNSKGVIVSISPENIPLKGVQLKDERSLQSLNAKAPLITAPFIPPSGNYLTSISYPIFSENKVYLGYIAGTIYLEQKNILNTILGKHGYKDGSYLYVVDRNHTIIYHPDEKRVGEVIDTNEVINAVTKGQKGGKLIVNSRGVNMLAGYAPATLSGWGIVTQRAERLTLATLNEQMWKVFIKSLPIGVITVLIIWYASVFISKPLWQLASILKNYESHTSTGYDLIKVKSWYFEASYLKRSFIKTLNIVSNTINQLHSDALTDSLTGLLNRRGLDRTQDNLRIQKIPFSVLALDIDHFKKVNDVFGHDVGDVVLKNVAEHLKLQARELDLVFRSGGEEFLLFLPKKDIYHAKYAAERIRKSIESQDFETVGHVTVSIGVAHWTAEGKPISAVLKEADDALYKAKNNGRNRTELSISN
jgi:diguanylate cyclase (GGDEF)-like protein